MITTDKTGIIVLKDILNAIIATINIIIGAISK
ncbi:Putative uncharacterized protein [Staphylococcus xylosus]|nr:Putative uncharacterized protein [Staphylococcus xylosus]